MSSNDEYVFLVIAQSMAPTIPKYSFIVVRPSNEYKVKDIIVYTRPDKFICVHRIVSITHGPGKEDNETVFTVKGDNDSSPPRERVTKNEVIGCVVRIIPVSRETYEVIRRWRLTYRSRTEDGWGDINEYLIRTARQGPRPGVRRKSV